MSTDKEIQDRIQQLMSKYDVLWNKPVYSNIKWVEQICLTVSAWYYRHVIQSMYALLYWWQRITRGYDDTDKWNAAWYIARKAIPVLQAMQQNLVGTSVKWHREDRFGNIIELNKAEIYGDDGPAAFSEDEWKAIIGDIIFAFQYILALDHYDMEYEKDKHEQNYKRHKRGLKLFSIYFMSLWD